MAKATPTRRERESLRHGLIAECERHREALQKLGIDGCAQRFLGYSLALMSMRNLSADNLARLAQAIEESRILIFDDVRGPVKALARAKEHERMRHGTVRCDEVTT